MDPKAVPRDFWATVEEPPLDTIMSLDKIARAAAEPKVNLVIGAYRDSEGNPYPFRVVRKADRMLLEMNLNYEYLPISGNAAFIDAAMELLYAGAVPRENLAAVQTIGGTGSVFLGAELLAKLLGKSTTAVYLPTPTWPNHPAIFDYVGWPTQSYRYLEPRTIGLDFEGMKTDIAEAPAGSVVILQTCAHNPTGVDPSREQWETLAEIFLAKGHLAFFDTAYHGFASGDIDKDTYPLRMFSQRGVPNVCAQSFSKNMGLYGERVGTFSIYVNDKDKAQKLKRMMETDIRRLYTTPPIHGSRLVHLILTDKTLRKEWEEEIKEVSSRITSMRKCLYDNLMELDTPGTWGHILTQIGMFSFLGLTKKQCDYCISQNVFITQNGRANMAGLTESTAKFLAKAISDAVKLDN
ncbi:unnamed protein product [Phytomonas sp. Hart1]|nr:unnamed protein product [Phytomonas sp. Hart1]|eukprot:CCW71916.1 unnamed protein product [Phytomonas sp. isolate Hart1]